jgi:two-component system sensor histidine kinase KdpD
MNRAVSLIAGIGGVALVTAVAFRAGLNLTTASLMHLVVVVLVARQGGFLIASTTSLFAAVCQLYFLVPPVLTWAVSDPQNWFSLAAFEYCALIVSGLSSAAEQQKRIAEGHRFDAEALYEASRRVLLMDRRSDTGQRLARMIQEGFGCRSVAMFDAASAKCASAGAPDPALEKTVRDVYFGNGSLLDEETGLRVEVLRTGLRPTGAIGMRGGKIGVALATAIASLAALALERARAFENEGRLDAVRQNEHLRTAVLDALAHEVKTPLTVIRAASSGLLEANDLAADQAELVTLIDGETERLNDVTNHLLGMARLDSRELRLHRQSICADDLIATVTRRDTDHRIRVGPGSMGLKIQCDPQLTEIALMQLIDNALKYSQPGSEVNLETSQQGSEVIIKVHNFGPAIPEADRERIFERFYRSPDVAHQVAGTGLGLSITRKIATAHGGRVFAESEPGNGTTFCIALRKA